MKNVGLVGGTFDPFHSGHLAIAEAALDSGIVSEVVLMPARVSPFKQGKEMAPDSDRLEMAKLAASGDPRITVSSLEMEHEDVSYTYRTLSVLKEERPKDVFWLIIGSDQFMALEAWYKGIDILRDFPIMLAPRPGFEKKDEREWIRHYEETYGARVEVLSNELIDVSSTEIKELIRSGESITGLVPAEIEKYIYEHGLYI